MIRNDKLDAIFNFVKEFCLKDKREIPQNEIFLLTGDASARKYYRVGDKKLSYVVCYDETFVNQKHDFYCIQKYLLEKGLRVPLIFHISPERHLFLLEDLGDKTFLAEISQIKDLDEEYNLYKKLVENIVLFQSLSLEESNNLSCYNRSFDKEKYNFEINMTHDYLINKFFNKKLSEKELKISDDFWARIIKELVAQNKFFVHRDYHSRNIMVKDGDLCIIDFQDARIGSPYYDLVSLLDDCYYSVSEENYIKLKKYYYEIAFNKKIITCSEDKFYEEYNIMLLQRAYKALGSFSMLYHRDNNVRYLKHIGFVIEKIKSALYTNKKFDDYRKLLMKFYYES